VPVAPNAGVGDAVAVAAGALDEGDALGAVLHAELRITTRHAAATRIARRYLNARGY
jgi:hypothetical protein